MDVFISHIWYIVATLLLGVILGMKFKEQIETKLQQAFQKAYHYFKKPRL